MGVLGFFWHLLGLVAPAFGVAVLTVVLGRFFIKNSTPARAIPGQIAINFVAGLVVLVGALLLLGQDGRMAAYLALVLVSASTQWVLQGAWRR